MKLFNTYLSSHRCLFKNKIWCNEISPLASISFDLGSSNLEKREMHKKVTTQKENTYICIPVQRGIYSYNQMLFLNKHLWEDTMYPISRRGGPKQLIILISQRVSKYSKEPKKYMYNHTPLLFEHSNEFQCSTKNQIRPKLLLSYYPYISISFSVFQRTQRSLFFFIILISK